MKTIKLNRKFNLENLEGVRRKKVPAIYYEKQLPIKDILDKRIALTDSGQNGAFNIWKDDEGKIRCEAMRYGITFNKKKLVKMGEIKKWINKMEKEIGNNWYEIYKNVLG